jgi:hypothetical protein
MDIHSSYAVKQADDLKQIRGIGPGIENRLREAQIFTYAQSLPKTQKPGQPPARVDRVNSRADYPAKLGWSGSAAGYLAERQKDSLAKAQYLEDENDEDGSVEERLPVENRSEDRNHLVNFSVELWLNEKNDVLRTRVLHIQNRAETAWRGSGEQRLLDFLRITVDLKNQAR